MNNPTLISMIIGIGVIILVGGLGLVLVGRARGAGHGLGSGVQLVGEEGEGPVAVEFSRVFEEQSLGVPIELALRNMADRIPVGDVRFFVVSVIIQRATGGALAEV